MRRKTNSSISSEDLKCVEAVRMYFRYCTDGLAVSTGIGKIKLPLTLLRTAQGHPILVELKSGETYNGVLVNVDHWMNLNLTKVTCTSREGDKFWKMTGIYIKGSMIKYMSIPEEVLAITPDELPLEKDEKKGGSKGGRGGRGGRGGGHKDSDRASSSHGGKSERGGRGGGRGHSDNARGANRGAGGSTRGNRGGQYKPRGSAK